jgi:uncharacterized SAM-binding protein YcdF (DUF218 family)
MPTRRSGRSRFRLALLVGVIALTGGAVWGARSLGHVLHHEDPLERADAIFVLGGRYLERVAEAGDLYVEGRAPIIVISRQLPDYGEEALRARGFDIPGETDLQIRALMQMGVPRNAIQVMEPQVATAAEAETIKQVAVQRGWNTIIVVTNKLHTARARLVVHRHLDNTAVRVVMRGTRYDHADLDHWWRTRSDLRFALLEAQKMLLYWIGIAD